jgi:peptidyl-tRNA hydrolase
MKPSQTRLTQYNNVILAKPLTYMNNSGKPVKRIIENYKLKIENLLVV